MIFGRVFMRVGLLLPLLFPFEVGFGQRRATVTQIEVKTTNGFGAFTTRRSVMGQPVFVKVIVQVPGTREDPVGVVQVRSGGRTVGRGEIRGRFSPGRQGVRTVSVTLTGAELKVGNHRLKAIFRGSDGFRRSESRPRRHRVDKANTQIELTTDAMDSEGQISEAAFGAPVRLAARVEPLPDLDLETARDGSVQFFSGNLLLGTSPVGEPLIVDSLAAEQHQLRAVYVGSPNYHPSSSQSHPISISFARTPTISGNSPGFLARDVRIFNSANGVILRRPSAAPTLDEFGGQVRVAVVYERQALANGPVEIEMQVWDFARSFLDSQIERFNGLRTVSDPAVGVGFPDIAPLLDGDQRVGRLVVVWQAPGAQGLEIFARLFSDDPFAQGPAFQVNSITGGNQERPRVSETFDGGFVVVWQSPVIEGSGTVIFQRRFDASGNPLGAESIVHPTLSGNQTRPEVAMLSTADYVVTWNDEGSRQVKGRQFRANATPRTDEFTLDATLVNVNDRGSRLAALPNSAWVGTWSRPESSSLILRSSVLRRFNAAASPLGGFEPITFAPNTDEFAPDVAPLAGGAFAAVWTGEDGVGSKGIGLRVYRPGGVSAGLGEFANSLRAGDQFDATVSPFFDGNAFVVFWTSNQPGIPGSSISFRSFQLPIGGL